MPEFPNPYFAPRGQPLRFPQPYRRTEFPMDPAASQESSLDPEMLRGRAAAMSPYRHDLRPAEGSCGRCNEPALSRCYTIGCHMQGVKMCAKHMTEEHDHHTLPEGVPHE